MLIRCPALNEVCITCINKLKKCIQTWLGTGEWTLIRVDIIPGISDHEVVYYESSFRPSRAATPHRKVFCYNKGDFDTLKAELRIIKKKSLNQWS